MLFGKKKVVVMPTPPAPAPAAPPPPPLATPPEAQRFEEIFAKVKSRGIDLREQMFAAAERGEFASIKPIADELFVLDFVAKNAQIAHAKACEEVAKK